MSTWLEAVALLVVFPIDAPAKRSDVFAVSSTISQPAQMRQSFVVRPRLETRRALPGPQYSRLGVEFPPTSASRTRQLRRSGGIPQLRISAKLVGALTGALVGLIAGGYIGAAIEGDALYDSPGLKGFVIGAPIGGTIAAVIGWRLVR